MSAKTDRELLELAAKAAGVAAVWSEWTTGRTAEFGCIRYTKNAGFRIDGRSWNPLTDDGDALRLAVRLRINIEHVSFMSGEKFEISCYPKGRGDCIAFERVSDDPQVICLPDDAATRRAIVRAAAEIGAQQ